MPGQRRISSASRRTPSCSAGIAASTASIASSSSARRSQNSSPPPGTTLNASPACMTVGTEVRRARAVRVVAGGRRLRRRRQRQQRVAAAVGRGAGVRGAPGRGDLDRPGRLAPHDHAVVAVRVALAALEAQARVPAREALDVGERRTLRHSSSHTSSSATSAKSLARAGRAARMAPSESTTPPFMSTAPEPTSFSPSRVSGRWSAWATTVSTWPSSSSRRVPVPRSRASRSGAWSGLEHGDALDLAPRRAAARRTPTTHSSAPCTSPEGEETATSASSSRTARRAISSLPACTHASMRPPSYYARRMPELPEMEITARRLAAALPGETLESAMTPGLNALKTFDPPLHALDGATFTGVRRRGQAAAARRRDRRTAPLTLLMHLMSAGRLQLFDKRASMRDRTSRVLLRLPERPRAAPARVRHQAGGVGEAADARRPRGRRASLRTLGPEAWPDPPALGELLASTAAAALAAARPAGDRRHRPHLGRRDPARRASSPRSSAATTSPRRRPRPCARRWSPSSAA